MTIKFPRAKRGNSYEHRLKFEGTSGSIASCKLYMFVKRKTEDPDSAALAKIDNETPTGGISIVTATSPYEIDIKISDEVMATLPAGDLVAGIQIELPDGKTEEIENIEWAFPVRADVVRRTAPNP
jgi:hypothetical protein